MRSSKKHLLLAGRVVLGLLFLAAGLTKVVSPQELQVAISNYRLLPTSIIPFVAEFLPVLEIVLAIGLLSGVYRRAAALGTGLLSLAFASAVVAALIRGLDIECGCFSGASKVSFTHLALNLLILGVSVSILKFGEVRKKDRAWPGFAVLLGVAALLSLAVHSARPQPVQSPASPDRSVPDSTSPASDAPLVFDPPKLHLGELAQGEPIEASVRFQNSGTRPLRILDVGKSCGCTAVSVDREVLAPGEWGELALQYQSDDRPGSYRVFVALRIEGLEEPVAYSVDVDLVPSLSTD
jgi:uncharacterized membrane protein YphA (DoxX/SURF4 family)